MRNREEIIKNIENITFLRDKMQIEMLVDIRDFLSCLDDRLQEIVNILGEKYKDKNHESTN